MSLFPMPEEFLPDAIIEMPCPWKIEEAFDGNARRNRTLYHMLQEDGATRAAIEDAWRYGMACESATIGYLYTGDPNAKQMMSYGHYFKCRHDGNRMWRVVVDVIDDRILTC